MFISPVQLTTSRIGNLTRLIHTLLYVMTIHIHTVKKLAPFHKNKIPRKKIAFERHTEGEKCTKKQEVHISSR